MTVKTKKGYNMNIFRTYVRRNLKNNRLRTVMTIMGIILSVALVTAVIDGAFSGVEYIRNVLKDTYQVPVLTIFNKDGDEETDAVIRNALNA